MLQRAETFKMGKYAGVGSRVVAELQAQETAKLYASGGAAEVQGYLNTTD